MAKTKTKPDITEAEIVETVETTDDVTTLITEDVVTNTLKKFSVTGAKVAQLTADYGALKILGPDDKENFKTVSSALSEVRNLRFFVENRRKELKRPVIDMGNAIDGEAKRITNMITPLENHLKAEVDRTEREIEERKRAEERRRIQALQAAGFQIVGQSYVLGGVGDFFDNIMAMDAEAFDGFLSDGKQEAERLAAERRRQEEEAAKLRAEQAELEEFRKWKAQQEADKAVELVQNVLDADLATPQAPATTTVDIWEAPERVQTYPNNVTEATKQPLNVWDVPQKTQGPTTYDYKPSPKSEGEMWYNNGFEAAKRGVLAILDSPEKFTRAQLKELINALKP